VTWRADEITARLELILAAPSLPPVEPVLMAQILVDETARMPGLSEDSLCVLLGLAAQLLKHGSAMKAQGVISAAMKH